MNAENVGPVEVDNSGRVTQPVKFKVTGDTFTIRATNPDDPKAHSSGPHPLVPNADGWATYVLTFAEGFSSDAVDVEVTGSDGSRAKGTIAV